jgi:hypothetical protein
VRSIEHGTLIDDDTASFVAERGAYIVPTMVVIFALVEMGRELGFPAVSQEKAGYAYQQALSGMDKMRSAGVKVGFGTDLLGSTYVQECRESTIRREVLRRSKFCGRREEPADDRQRRRHREEHLAAETDGMATAMDAGGPVGKDANYDYNRRRLICDLRGTDPR